MKKNQDHFSEATLIAMAELKKKLEMMDRQKRKFAFATLKCPPTKK
jgi:hypothetical protein